MNYYKCPKCEWHTGVDTNYPNIYCSQCYQKMDLYAHEETLDDQLKQLVKSLNVLQKKNLVKYLEDKYVKKD